MSALALGIIVIAAFTHASWNYAAKRAGGGLPFVWLSCAIGFVLYLPIIAGYWLWRHPVLPPGAAFVVAGSGLIKAAYSLLLQRGYQTGDFSLIYPLARGTGPLLSTMAAILLFGERPTALAITGGLIIVGSVFYLTGGTSLMHQSRIHLRNAVFFGFATGTCIAGYTLWDQRAMSHMRLSPLLYDFGTCVTMLLLLTSFAIIRRNEVGREWREHRRHAAIIAVLGPVGYVLILTAMSFTPVSYIAPAREISIVIGAFFGVKLLKETDAKRRLIAAGGMLIGIISLALG